MRSAQGRPSLNDGILDVDEITRGIEFGYGLGAPTFFG